MKEIARSFRLVCDSEYEPLVKNLLRSEGFEFEPEPFSDRCQRLLHEPFPLGSSLAAFFGYIYIQDRSSMLPPLALAPGAGASVLDLAASPGSKTGFLAQLTGLGGFVLGNEPNPARLATLRANLFRSNLVQAATCSYAGESIPLPPGWPYILLDPPCSGWGTAAKNPKVLKLWQGVKTNKLADLQRALLRQAAKLLAPGGRLLYSTCTTNPQENEAQTDYAVNELGLTAVPLAPFAGFQYSDTCNGSLLIDGEASASQSFYLSLLEQPISVQPEPQENTWYVSGAIEPEELKSPLCDPALLPEGEIMAFGGKARFIPCPARSRLPVDFKWQGCMLGKWDSGAFTPSNRLRITLPRKNSKPEGPALVLEKPEEVRALLTGQSIGTDINARAAGLWWQALPLGICPVKNGRVIAGFR